MPEFSCFVSGSAGALIIADTAQEAREIYLELLRSELSVASIVAAEMDDAQRLN